MASDFHRGYVAGYQAAQPEWISVKDRLPDQDGLYFTISESQKGGVGFPIGAIAIETSDTWQNGKWYQDDEFWKVLYWAKPVPMAVPECLSKRQRLGAA